MLYLIISPLEIPCLNINNCNNTEAYTRGKGDKENVSPQDNRYSRTKAGKRAGVLCILTQYSSEETVLQKWTSLI